jgi:ABC-type antimicrobial peptide transport system ATPase subunit
MERLCLENIICRLRPDKIFLIFTLCGARLGVVGQSGAGESTPVLILSGLVQPGSGAMLADVG